MSGSRRSALIVVLVSAVIGLSARNAGAQQTTTVPPSPDGSQDTTTQTTTGVTPHRRSLIERVIFKLDDELLLQRLIDAPRGFYLRVGGVGEGSGFGLGPAFRHNTAVFDFKTSAAASMKRYFVGEGSLRFPGTIGQDAYTRASGPYLEIYGRRRDFPQEDFFGLGPESQLSDRSNFAVRDSVGRVTGGVESRWLKAGVNAGYLDVTSGAGTDTLMPSSTDVFTAAELPGVGVPLKFVVIEPFVELATMDRARNDLAGGIYRVSAAHHRDESDRYSFLRWEADLRHYFTFLEDTRAIALHAWASSARPDDAGGEVPFYLQPTLGGARTLRGYRSFRFRDRSALLLQAEYRWRINDLVTGALFYDTGTVARTFDDFGRFERNYGVSLRAGVDLGAVFRMDLAFGGREGTRFLIRFDDVF
jgi:hypothetical protein